MNTMHGRKNMSASEIDEATKRLALIALEIMQTKPITREEMREICAGFAQEAR